MKVLSQKEMKQVGGGLLLLKLKLLFGLFGKGKGKGYGKGYGH